jgi:hypothetical protein
MTFQNLITRIPQWNSTIIETEKKRICDKSGGSYLEDLLTCVYIIQLKILTAMRVGQKQKKININIPKLDDFIHKIYINVARKLYKNVYLFEINIPPLQIQKNYRELEILVQECMLNTLRESIPVEAILKAYMDETLEEDIIEEIKEQIIEEPIKEIKNTITPTPIATNETHLSFNDIDSIKMEDGNVSNIIAPKTISRLEEISELRSKQRKIKAEEEDKEEENENENEKLTISNESFNLDNSYIDNIEEPLIELLPDLLIDEIEDLD